MPFRGLDRDEAVGASVEVGNAGKFRCEDQLAF